MTDALTKKDYRIVAELMASCRDLSDVARVLGMTTSGLRKAVAADPDGRLAKAIEEGRCRLRHNLVHSLYVRAMNPKNAQGSAAGMFLLKTLFGFDDRPGGGDSESHVNVVINLPGAMTEEGYRRKLAAAHPELLAEIEAETIDVEAVEVIR